MQITVPGSLKGEGNHMKIIHSKYVNRRIIKNVFKMLFAFVLIFTGLLIVPDGNHQVYAAHLEDCDLDGFDDATGVPVPWPGYDETKGDTPDGPGGSKTSGTPSGSTTSNNDGTGTTGAVNSSAGDTTSSTTNNTANTSTSNATDSTAGSTANNTKSDTKSNTTTSTKNSTTSSTKNSTANTTSSETASDKVNSTISENSNSKPTEKGSNVISKNSSSGTTETTSSAPVDSPSTATTDNTSGEATGKTEDVTSGDTGNGEKAAVTSSEGGPIQGDSEVTEESAEPANIDFTDLSEGFIDSIINTKGTLAITEATGSLFHAGGTIIITGSGFEGNVDRLEIEIHSEPQRLGVVASNEEGSFDIQVNLPESLEPGTHQIVVLYQGNEIVRQQIEVGSKTADSFLQALSVGFTSDNKGLIPGLAILGGLFVLGLVVLVINELIRSRRAKKQVLVQ